MIDSILYGFFIFVHLRASTLELEEHDLSELPFRKSVEYDIVTAFSDKYHILRSIWEVRECWEYLLIDLAEYRTARTLSCLFPHSSMLMEGYDPHNKNPDQKPE